MNWDEKYSKPQKKGDGTIMWSKLERRENWSFKEQRQHVHVHLNRAKMSVILSIMRLCIQRWLLQSTLPKSEQFIRLWAFNFSQAVFNYTRVPIGTANLSFQLRKCIHSISFSLNFFICNFSHPASSYKWRKKQYSNA